ncbi:MAG: hypothetical protein JWN64_118 [Parcubacteria group bacterium]|nr:hypothetical protein [Parcubacteria group bacterium]
MGKKHLIQHVHMENRGFTLIELMVVIAIIGLLSTILFSSFTLAQVKARDAGRLQTMHSMQQALELFYSKYNAYPCGALPAPSPGITVATDGDWLHTGTQPDTFLDGYPTTWAQPCGGAYPWHGIVAEALLPAVKDGNGSYYAYDVSVDRQKYILYVNLQDPVNATRMANDGGLRSCYYEIGNGVGTMTPQWLCPSP